MSDIIKTDKTTTKFNKKKIKKATVCLFVQKIKKKFKYNATGVC